MHARIRALVDKIGMPNASPFSHVIARPTLFKRRDLRNLQASGKQYDIGNHRRVVDASEFEEYRAEYGDTLLVIRCIAAGRRIVPIKKGTCRPWLAVDQSVLEFAAWIYTESAEKAARFISIQPAPHSAVFFMHE